MNLTRNELRTLIQGIRATGAGIPADLTALVDHALELRAVAVEPRANARAAAVDLLEHLGQPANLSKALSKAADTLNRDEAETRIAAYVAELALGHALTRVRQHAEILGHALGEALAPHLAALNSNAGQLGARFSTTGLSNAPESVLVAYRATEDARVVVDAALESLRLLYTPGPEAGRLTRLVWSRLPAVHVPDGLSVSEASNLADAIEGMRLLGGELAVARHDRDGYWPARVAALGGRFEWATPAETMQRASRLRAALTPKAKTREQVPA